MGFLGRLTGTVVTLLVAAIIADFLRVLEQSVALLAIPSHVGSYALQFSFSQGRSLLGVAWIAGGIFIGLGSGKR